jgi:hypothetical protein
LAAGFYRANLDLIAASSAEAVTLDDHRVCAFVIRDVAGELSRLWDHPVPTDWAQSCQNALWPKLHTLLDMLEVQHSANDILVALNQIIDVAEAIIRAA